MREEGAVGGSVAGSTAGWWPSDRDRFPPRFLLPPSLQTHNCIISTHLGYVPSSSRLPPILSFSFFLPLSFLSLFLSFSFVCQLSAHLSLRSDPVCAFARLLLSRLLVRPVDRPLLYLSLSFSLCRHPLRLLSSFARKRCHTRETARHLLRSPLLHSTTSMR